LPEHKERAVVLTCAVLVVVPFLSRLALLKTRGFNPDELQHLHSAWCVSKGLVPYRDYFDHHTPLLHFFLAPFFRFFALEVEVNDAFAVLFFARAVMWVFTGAILLLTYAMGSVLGGRTTGALAALALSNVVMFLSKSLEVRPDVPATALLLGAVLCAMRASVAPALALRSRHLTWLASGLALGTALMCTQKVAFPALGLGVAVLVSAIGVRGEGQPRVRWSEAVTWVMGIALPAALVVGYFARQGALRQFVASNVLINLRWKGRIGPRGILWELAQQNPLFVALSAAGMIVALLTWLRREENDRGTIFPATAALAGVSGLALIPVVFRQYFLLFLPLLAVLAAIVGASVLKRLGPLQGGRAAVASIALLALSVRPLAVQAQSFGRSNTGTLEALRSVLRNTSPQETVLDGFSGLGVFRPHAFHYFFMHEHLRAMWPPEVEQGLLAGLRSGRILPKLVIWDSDVQALSPEIVAFLERHYVPVDPEPLRARLFDNDTGYWTDEGARPLVEGRPGAPHVLIGEGWKKPETTAGIAYRPARAERSWLLVPVRSPRAATVWVHAQLASPAPEASLELAINRTSMGQKPLQTGWHDYQFHVREGILVRGLNRFTLHYRPVSSGQAPAVNVASIDVRR
jgi:hypothetical protein